MNHRTLISHVDTDLVTRGQLRAIETPPAKAMMHDVFAMGFMPLRLLPEASQAYFEPKLAEFEPRRCLTG